MRRFNFVALQLFLQWLICLICLSCSGDHAAQDVSKQNFVVKEGTRSIDIKEVNNYISTANITMLADLKYNRALIVHHGVIVDSFPIITGGYSAQNFSQSQTPLGVFTVHAIDYCPPWYSASTKEGKIPCTDANRLGPYSLWFKDGYIYGVHGRPPNKYLQQLFTSLGSSDRKGSKGCIVVPQDHLKNFIDLIFDDPAFKNHPGVKKIKELRSRKDPTNVFIALQNFQEKIPYFYNIK